MKTKKFLIPIFAGLFMLAFTSCKQDVDRQLSAFEKSIDKLEQNYKDLTPTRLEDAINACEVRLEWLIDHKEDFTTNQRNQFSELRSRYYWLLVKVQAHYLISKIIKKYGPVLDYIQILINKLIKDIASTKLCHEQLEDVDMGGRLISPCGWIIACAFSEGLARVEADDGLAGYIDATGNIAIPCKCKIA